MSQTGDSLTKSKNYDFHKIKNFIEDGFMHKWAISIEYAVKTHQDNTKWIKWEKTIFAVKDSRQVMEEIMACCKNNPDCSMKLICEHFRPECRLTYWICHKKNEASGYKIQSDHEMPEYA